MPIEPAPTFRFIRAVLTLSIAFASGGAAQAAGDTTAHNPSLRARLPDAGTVYTLGYVPVGKVSGVEVTARVMTLRDTTIRAVAVDVNEGLQSHERALIDEDELPDLLAGVTAMLAISANPTPFPFFEVRYRTRDDLLLVAFNDKLGAISYSVTAGSITSATRFLDPSAMRKFAGFLSAARDSLTRVAR